MKTKLNERMKNIIEKGDKLLKSKHTMNVLRVLQLMLFVGIFSSKMGFAAATFDTMTAFIAGWVQKIGGVVAFIGVFFWVQGWRSDDPSEQNKGMKTAVSGLMMIALGTGYKTWM